MNEGEKDEGKKMKGVRKRERREKGKEDEVMRRGRMKMDQTRRMKGIRDTQTRRMRLGKEEGKKMEGVRRHSKTYTKN